MELITFERGRASGFAVATPASLAYGFGDGTEDSSSSAVTAGSGHWVKGTREEPRQARTVTNKPVEFHGRKFSRALRPAPRRCQPKCATRRPRLALEVLRQLFTFAGMNRREFLSRTSLFAAAGLLGRRTLVAAGAASQTPLPPAGSRVPLPASAMPFGTFTPLRRNVGIFSGRGGTIAWLAAKDALAVVDTQFPDTAATCLTGLPGRAGRRIDVVVNTHHHADHTSGNPIFRPAAGTLVAQANVPKLQFAAAERAERDPHVQSWARLDQQVYADTTFVEAWRHELGDETITAQYFGPAHTNGDAIVMFEKANVVHLGDLVFNRIYPVIDRLSGASARSWVAILERAVKTYPVDAIYVFGHANSKFGPTGKRDDLLVMRDYWSAVIAHVEKGIAAGKSRSEIADLANLPGFEDFHATPPTRLPANLSAVYDELTEKA